MTIEFDTRDFEFAHGKAPRGYGSWAFKFEGRELVFAPTSTYADAKKWVRAEVKRVAPPDYQGHVVVKVCT